MARVIGGDFKKNKNIKLTMRRGEIDALYLSVGFMKTQLYVPTNIRSVTQEAQINKNTILNISFSDGKHVVVSVRGKEAERFIAFGVAADRKKEEAFTQSALGNLQTSQKTKPTSPTGAIIMLAILTMIIPFIVFTLVENNGYMPVIIAGLLAILYLYFLWKPRAFPLGNARWKAGILVFIFGTGVVIGLGEISLQADLVALKAADPKAYLVKLRDIGRHAKWLEELEHIDRPAYIREKQELAQRRIDTDKAERLADEKLANEKAERQRCSDKTTAFTYATILIEKRLKNPDAADFHLMGARRSMLECGRWRIQSTFDGTNGFGATIRTNYYAIVRRVGKGHWLLEEFETW